MALFTNIIVHVFIVSVTSQITYFNYGTLLNNFNFIVLYFIYIYLILNNYRVFLDTFDI